MDTAARITLVRQLLHAVYLPLLRESGETAEAQILREDSGSGARCQFSERFLQAVWNEQRLRAPLHTVDGRPLSVVTPGTWNLGPGPDFSQATLLLAGTPVTGDVEIHHAVGDWHQHGHDRDPLYRNVVLHVVWQARPEDLRPELPPCLSLRELIDRPWPILSGELQMDDYPYARQVAPGGCARELAAQPDDRLRLLLQVAGLARFAEKSNRLRRDIVAKGADQTLHEAFFDALGYRANRLPFRRLAEAVAQIADKLMKAAGIDGTVPALPESALPDGKSRGKQPWMTINAAGPVTIAQGDDKKDLSRQGAGDENQQENDDE